MLGEFIRDEGAVNVVLGKILNLVAVMALTASIVSVFYLYTDSSSQKSIRAGFADLGSQIARDITNMYLTSENSKNINLSVKHDIPLTFGGRGYRIELKDAKDGEASVEITDEGFFGSKTSTRLSSIDASVNASGVAYSGSGEIDITMKKNSTGAWVWIK